MSLNSMQIPVIDFAGFGGDPSTRSAISRQIYQACHEIGFVYLRHHGIEHTLIDQLFGQGKPFFDLPAEEKLQLGSPMLLDEWLKVGYVGLKSPETAQDFKESVSLFPELSSEDLHWSDISGKRILQPTTSTPLELNFQQTLLKFFYACQDLADRVFRAFAIALGIPESFFISQHGLNYDLRLLHYPPLPGEPRPGQLRAREHVDYSSLTLLFQDDVGGLEIRTLEGNWIPAPHLPDTVLINIGEPMQKWTNDLFHATQHRVTIPRDERAQQSRFSAAFFCDPNQDAELSCLDTCQSPERPALYKPIRAGEYISNVLSPG